MDELAKKILGRETPAHLKRYCEYIRNTGEAVGVSQFDEDWEPVGPQLRADMKRHGLYTTDALGIMKLTEAGKALAND